VEAPEEPTPRREADYVILVGDGEEGPFVFKTTVHLERSAGQREARRRFVQQDPEVRTRMDDGEDVFVVAIPARSWAPTQVRIEQPPPRLHV
jgi:hypothetical protein